MRISLVVTAALFLAGCGLGTRVVVDLRTSVTRAQIEADGIPKLFVEVERIGYQAFFSLAARNDDVLSWQDERLIGVSTRNGLLVATRGFPTELMSSDFAASYAALTSGSTQGFYPRFQTTLDGEDAVQYQTQQCEVVSRAPDTVVIFGLVHQTVRIVERCHLPGRFDENTYWLGGDGTVLKSRQWLSDRLGHIEIERVS